MEIILVKLSFPKDFMTHPSFFFLSQHSFEIISYHLPNMISNEDKSYMNFHSVFFHVWYHIGYHLLFFKT